MCGAVVTRLEEDGRRVIIGGDRYIVVELAKPDGFLRRQPIPRQGAGTALMHHPPVEERALVGNRCQVRHEA
jgi:hypothetical protein